MDIYIDEILCIVIKYLKNTDLYVSLFISKKFAKIVGKGIKTLITMQDTHLMMKDAIKYGSVSQLLWIEKMGFYYQKHRICEIAASGGNLEVLIYVHENGYPWNEYTSQKAAGNGSLECLKYIHENGCPWDEYISLCAVYGGLSIFKYCYDEGCPWIRDKCLEICEAQNKHDIIDWILNKEII